MNRTEKPGPKIPRLSVSDRSGFIFWAETQNYPDRKPGEIPEKPVLYKERDRVWVSDLTFISFHRSILRLFLSLISIFSLQVFINLLILLLYLPLYAHSSSSSSVTRFLFVSFIFFKFMFNYYAFVGRSFNMYSKFVNKSSTLGF